MKSPASATPLIVQVICCALACLWGTWILLQFRTQEWGFRPRSALFVAAMFVAPATLLLTHRRSPRVWLTIAAAIWILSLGASEAVAALKEHLFKRQALATTSAEVVSASHWWPFEHHGMLYDPRTQTFSAHD